MERKIKSFEDLEVWKFCRELLRLADQIIRAARSVTNNLAEGYGRFHYQENIQFCRQSRGSLYELIDHLIICLEEEYVNNEQFTKYRDDCIRGIQLVNGYIRFLSKQKKEAQ